RRADRRARPPLALLAVRLLDVAEVGEPEPVQVDRPLTTRRRSAPKARTRRRGGTGRSGSRRNGTRCNGAGCTGTGSDGGSHAGGGAGVGQGAVRDDGGAEPAQRVAHGRGSRVRAGGGQGRAPGRDAEDGEVDAVRSGRGPVAGPRPGRAAGQGLRGAAHVPTRATP